MIKEAQLKVGALFDWEHPRLGNMRCTITSVCGPEVVFIMQKIWKRGLGAGHISGEKIATFIVSATEVAVNSRAKRDKV